VPNLLAVAWRTEVVDMVGRLVRVAVGAVIVAIASLVPIGPAHAAVGLIAQPTWPSTMSVGDTGVPAVIRVENVSTPPDDDALMTVSNISLVPACEVAQAPCPDPAGGVFDLSASGVGRAGSACAGVTFTISAPDQNGAVLFTPSAPFSLGPQGAVDACFIDFTFDVVGMPQDGNGFAVVRATGTVDGIGTSDTGFAPFQVSGPPQVTLSTTAIASTTVGNNISDTAVVTAPLGAPAPSGSVTFTLFGPNNPTCTGNPIFTSTDDLTGGIATSDSHTTVTAGTYNWVAVYSDDPNYASVTSPCGAEGETSVVGQAAPSITTTASPSVAIGGSVSDTATLRSGFHPAGTITFDLYGPDDNTCAGDPAFTSEVPVNAANGDYTSGTFTPTVPGTYRWIAQYSGDVNNAAVSGECNDEGESVVVRATPTLTTQASPGGPGGTMIVDTATLTGGTNPTGTITFRLYGPDNATCTDPALFTSMVAVSGNGTYTSGTVGPTTPGVYRWIASYSGDANNVAVAGACNDANESVTISGRSGTKLVVDPVILRIVPLKITLGTARARLTSGGAPVAGQRIVFRTGGAFVCSDTTNANGVATCTVSLGGLVASILNFGIDARFAGNDQWKPASAHNGLVQIA
jgi:hypothetical protein